MPEVKVHRDKKDRKREWLEEEVLVEFMNLEEPGMILKFNYGDASKPEKYTLMHGGKYRLPRKIIKHIESRETPIWKYKPDGDGRMQKELGGRKSRFQCREVFE